MGEIAEKFADAASMFWLNLDSRERQLLVVGLVWVIGLAVTIPLERSRQQRERELLIDQVLERLEARRG